MKAKRPTASNLYFLSCFYGPHNVDLADNVGAQEMSRIQVCANDESVTING